MHSAAACLQAENNNQDPELSRVLRLVASPQRLAKLPPPVREIAELFDGRRNTAEVLSAARISEAKGQAVVKKLAAMNVLTELPRQKRTAFSELEESFFASNVEPIDECELPFETLAARVSRALGGRRRLPNTIVRRA
jgi:hypothetical protein